MELGKESKENGSLDLIGVMKMGKKEYITPYNKSKASRSWYGLRFGEVNISIQVMTRDPDAPRQGYSALHIFRFWKTISVKFREAVLHSCQITQIYSTAI